MTEQRAGDDTGLLDEESVVPYLARRRLIDSASAEASELGGGVSNVVLAVSGGRRRLVVKQALPRLRVADVWTAPTSRALTEADALELAGRLTPVNVPRLLDRDETRHVLVVDHAPDRWRDWKGLLLRGAVDPAVAARLGDVLGTWHAATTDPARLPARVVGGADAFEQLRVDPFYRAVARAAPPDLAGPVLGTAAAMKDRRTCLVHGDFSPKNVLVSPTGDGLWVIDFEVAHIGDPAFDLAFLLCHLTLKAVHLPELAADYGECMAAFAARYELRVDAALTPDWPYVMCHVGCLLLARVRGKSPAEYLTDAERAAAWRLGADVLRRPPGDVAGLVVRCEEGMS